MTHYQTLSWLDVVNLLNEAGIQYVECGVSTVDKSAWVSGVIVPRYNRNGVEILNRAGWVLAKLKTVGAIVVLWGEAESKATFLVPVKETDHA